MRLSVELADSDNVLEGEFQFYYIELHNFLFVKYMYMYVHVQCLFVVSDTAIVQSSLRFHVHAYTCMTFSLLCVCVCVSPSLQHVPHTVGQTD